MAILRERPYAGLNFLVDLGDGVTDTAEAGVCEVVLPEARIHTIEYREGNQRETEPIKLHSVTHYTNAVLKRGALGSLNWYRWWNEVRNGNAATARTVEIQLLDEERAQVVLSWRLLRARPVAHRFSSLDATVGHLLIESLELAFERIEME